MANVFANLIKRGLKTLDDVPKNLQAQAKETCYKKSSGKIREF